MLCTNCHAPVLPIVALDIDGTMAVYHDDFTQFAQRFFGRPFPWGYKGGSFAKHLGLTTEQYRQAKLAYRQGGGKRSMPRYRHADLLAKWSKENSELWITTTRPYNRFDSTDPDTREWLRRNGIDYDHLLYDDRKYEVLALTVGSDRVACVVDDLPENVNMAADYGMPAILVNRPYNKAATIGLHPRVMRAKDLRHALNLVQRCVTEWEQRNGT